jgi:hypothetical protein
VQAARGIAAFYNGEAFKDSESRFSGEVTAISAIIAASPKMLEAVKAASLFIGWYRTMSIEGQISVSQFAFNKRPVGWGGDYELMKVLDTAIKRAESTI